MILLDENDSLQLSPLAAELRPFISIEPIFDKEENFVPIYVKRPPKKSAEEEATGAEAPLKTYSRGKLVQYLSSLVLKENAKQSEKNSEEEENERDDEDGKTVPATPEERRTLRNRGPEGKPAYYTPTIGIKIPKNPINPIPPIKPFPKTAKQKAGKKIPSGSPRGYKRSRDGGSGAGDINDEEEAEDVEEIEGDDEMEIVEEDKASSKRIGKLEKKMALIETTLKTHGTSLAGLSSTMQTMGSSMTKMASAITKLAERDNAQVSAQVPGQHQAKKTKPSVGSSHKEKKQSQTLEHSNFPWPPHHPQVISPLL